MAHVTPDPDRDVVQRLLAGDGSAFDEIMARYKRPVLNFVYRMTGNAHDTEDIAQDVFIRVHQHIQRFRFSAGKFSTWIFQLARNAAIDHLRRRSRDNFQRSEKPVENFPTTGKSPCDDAQASQIGEAIAVAMGELPEDQRTAIVLAEYHGLSHIEIGEVMECSAKSVESRIYRAKLLLRKRLHNFLA